MSDSPKRQPVSITIRAGDPGTEIFLMDSDLQRIAQAVGVLNTEQPAGIYQVKLRAGTSIQEDLVKVGKTPFEKSYPPLAISSPVPLQDTYQTHEFHVDNAEAHSTVQHVDKGSGSFIYIFARDWTSKTPGEGKNVGSETYDHPARGLKLIDKDGVELVDFEKQSAAELKCEPWAACNVKINPGSYILRLHAPDGSVWERTLVASPNWQTQCFLLQRYFGESKGPDIAGATVVTRKQELGFSCADKDLRLIELARLALINERPIMSAEVEDLLTRKFENPLLGIFGAHLLIELEQSRGRPYEPGLLEHVIKKLRDLLQHPHPDVEALAWKAGLRDADYKFEMPPMIRRSWTLMTHASADKGDVIPPDSLNTHIYDRILVAEPWLVWAGEQQADDESQVLETLALYLQAQESAQEQPPARPGLKSLGSVSFDLAPKSVETNEVRDLTQQLSIPRSVIEQYLPRAREKAKDLQRHRDERSARKKARSDSD
jgi:hypothetical protein